MTAVRWLAEATGAEVHGLEVGSHTLEFRPADPPTALRRNLGGERISIVAGSGAASAMLIFQAVFPFLLFAGNASDASSSRDTRAGTRNEKEGEGKMTETGGDQDSEPIELEIHGGTNVSFSPSWEYVDQVLLPALEDIFGLGRIERRLVLRRWAQGSSPDAPRGTVYFKFCPLRPGRTLKPSPSSPWARALLGSEEGTGKISRIDATVLAPAPLLAPLKAALALDREILFPDAEVRFPVAEESGHASQIYVLLVAVSTSGLRWGWDWLNDRSMRGLVKKGGARERKEPEDFAREISQRVCRGLRAEVDRAGGLVDEYLQDQLVVFQALAEGRTFFSRGAGPSFSSRAPRAEHSLRKEGNDGTGEIEDLERSVAGLKLDKGNGGEEKGERVLKKDKRTHEPFGEGSMHTTTARWVASELLPAAQWFNRGTVCEGAGVSFPE